MSKLRVQNTIQVLNSTNYELQSGLKMGLRKINKDIDIKKATERRSEAFMKVAGRLLNEYEKSLNYNYLLEAQTLIEFVAEDQQLRQFKK